jgi:hypothetical protein
MNQVLQAHVFLSCLLSMILSPSWAVGEDWKLTFDQLSSHEMSFRIVVNADGKIAAFTKQRKSKEFEETSRSTITNDTVEDLRCKVIKLQQTLQTAELKKKSASGFKRCHPLFAIFSLPDRWRVGKLEMAWGR